jgi:hypothetical protein
MASEAMNIKTLNAVILASPRKQVEQSTGRILRVRVDQRTVSPVIVDIIDDHMMYKSQWKKRMTYYKKCSYQIERWNMEVVVTPVPTTKVKPATTCMIED